MIEGWAVLVLVSTLVIGPLAWRVVHDRRQQAALAVRADVRHALDRALGGESLVSIDVTPPTPWRSGRVVLSIPSDWRWLLQRTSATVLARVPAGYELVVQQRPAATRSTAAWAEPRRASA